MPWPRRSAKGRDDRGADGDGGRVDKAHDEDEASPSMPPTRKKAPLGFGAATLNASLSPVSGSLTSIQVKRPSSSQSVSDTINKLLKPRGPGYCDHSAADRAANLVTCLPYCLLAARNASRARTGERGLYAGALCAVSAFSTAYHALDGSHKEAWARKADYWAIACAATAMGRMLFPKGDCPGFYEEADDDEKGRGAAGGPSSTSFSPSAPPPPPSLFPPRRGRTRVSLSLTPFQPFAVITAHSLAMEAEFARRARRDRRRRNEAAGGGGGFPSSSHHHHKHHHHHHHHHANRVSISSAHRLHVYSGAAAVAAFFAEELWPRLPFVHSAWHVLSAVAMAATEPLVDDAERRLLRGRARAASAARSGAAEAEAAARKRGGGGEGV